jgi:hypothetical protein
VVYVGVDVHRKRSHVVALHPTGEVVLSRRIGNAPVEFLRIFGDLEPQPIEVAFEATYGWSWFAALLADAGIAAHMAYPRQGCVTVGYDRPREAHPQPGHKRSRTPSGVRNPDDQTSCHRKRQPL